MNHEIIAILSVGLRSIAEVVGNQFVAEILVVLDLVGRGVVDLGPNFSFWQSIFI